MTLALAKTAADAYSDSLDVLVPEDGDDLDAHQIEAALQRLLNRVLFARYAAAGALTWTESLAVSGSAAAPVVLVGAISTCVLEDGDGVRRAYSTATESTLGASHVEGGGSLAADTWYHVYAWSDDAAPTALKFQISTSPPTTVIAPRTPTLWKRGETANYRYLGSFYAATSGTPRPVRMARGQYLYRASAVALPSVITLTIAAAWGDVDLSAWLPPHARFVQLRAEVQSLGTATTVALGLRTKGDTASAITVRAGFAPTAAGDGEGAINTTVVDLEVDDNQFIQRQTVGANLQVVVVPHGWRL